jgi:putative ABC transport system substrate-binding protein
MHRDHATHWPERGGFRLGARLPGWGGLRMGQGWICACLWCVAAAAWLASVLPAWPAERPLQIGVLALGPRYVPVWACGQATRLAGAEEPRHDIRPDYLVGLLDQLKKLGYVEDLPENAAKPGRRFVLDFRTGSLPQVKAFAREFAKKPVDIIVAIATLAVSVAKQETRGSNIPILMAAVSEPVMEGFVKSLARPEGNITGVSHQLVQGSGKRVELFKEMFPSLQHMITMRMPNYTPSEKSMIQIRAAAKRLNVDVIDWTVNSRAEIQSKLAEMHPAPNTGFMVAPDSLMISNLDLVIETSLAQRIPTFTVQGYMARWGGLAAYGPSAFEAGARVAGYLDKIAKGAKPGELPVEAIDPSFVINLKAADCLGITLPPEVLHEADSIIR